MQRPDYYGFRNQRKRARRRGGWKGSMRLGALFAVLVGINLYVFFFRGGTSIQDILKTSAINKATTSQKADKEVSSESKATSTRAAEPRDDSIVLQGSLKGHLGLSSALAAQKLSRKQVSTLIAALRTKLNMRGLRPAHRYEVRLDPKTGKIRKFTYRLSTIKSVVVKRSALGGLTASREEVKLDIRKVRLGGVVSSSLNSTMSRAGEGAALVAQFTHLFSWDVNWYADPRVGDVFRIIVEKKYMGDKFFAYGRILAAEYKGAKGTFRAYYHKSRNGKQGHYTADGRNVKRTFLKMPLNFRRISSKFNKRRFHPVLHKTKGHFGVDYAAARGTPAWAPADGTIVVIGRYGAAGNMIKLSHARGVETVYMHLSRFARKLKRGSKVRQRQVIGFVGTTGRSTGPHLHYGIKVRGKHVDPMKFNVGRGELLPSHERRRLRRVVAERSAALAAISTEHVASK